jgi:hypothetical protein
VADNGHVFFFQIPAAHRNRFPDFLPKIRVRWLGAHHTHTAHHNMNPNEAGDAPIMSPLPKRDYAALEDRLELVQTTLRDPWIRGESHASMRKLFMEETITTRRTISSTGACRNTDSLSDSVGFTNRGGAVLRMPTAPSR